MGSKNDIRLPPKWIELNLTKRECVSYIPSPYDEVACQCGRKKIDHGDFVKHRHHGETWNAALHTQPFPTDAYGTILFEGEHHPNKAHYVRLSYDTNPELVIQLLTLVWGIEMPKLVISVRGGDSNFELSPRLGKILQTGLLKAAKSTGAWVFTGGLNRGVSKHVGNVLSSERWMGFKRGRMISIGIAPWGVVEHRNDLIGRNRDRVYSPLEHAGSNLVLLNPRHSNFLLVDNGSVGKMGGETYFRRRLEKTIACFPTSLHRGCDTPVVCIVVEGGYYTLRIIGDSLHDDPPVPVVVFSGTGRTADLIATTFKKIQTGIGIESLRAEIYILMMKLYHANQTQCAILFKELKRILSRKSLVTIYSHSTNDEEFDAVILASIFRSQHWSPLQQLSLTLVWDRVDIATNEVFVYGREWSRDQLEHAMMEALVSNRLDFVHLLLEHGLNMKTFLTAARLERLYSLEHSHSKLMKILLYELAKIKESSNKNQGSERVYERNLTLHDVGYAIIHMMGHLYKSNYVQIHTQGNLRSTDAFGMAEDDPLPTFTQPFDDLFVWAVLTKRHDMALLLWRHGQGALAKALVAVKLNKYFATKVTSSKKAKPNIIAEFQGYANIWENLSLELLDAAFRSDSKQARQLLTMELDHWSKQTCLTLAVMANHRMLLGHPCCQSLLADLWMGALNIHTHAVWKIILGIIFPPFIFCLEYKTTEQLKLLPHEEKLKHGSGNGLVVTDIRNNEEEMSVGMDTFDLQTNQSQSKSSMSSIFRLGKNISKGLEHRALKHKENRIDLTKVASQLKMSKLPGISNVKSRYPINEISAKQRNKTQFNETLRTPDDFLTLASSRSTQQNVTTLNVKTPIYASQHLKGGVYQPKASTPVTDQNRSSFVTTRHNLGFCSKFYEFQKAPVTNFYRHTIAYIIFVSCLAYVILVPRRVRSGYIEMYIIAYLVTLGCDIMREFISIDAMNCAQKWIIKFGTELWPLADLIFISLVIIGVGLKYGGYFEYGMLLYRISSIYWNLRLFKYMGVHQFVGPKIVMMRRMLKHMAYFAVIILVIIIAFGIAREAIRFPLSEPTWHSISDAILEPYVMMFGEVDTDSLVSPQCGKDDGLPECPVGYWIIPVIWAVYMMVANILIVNVLIAVFNGIYSEVDAIATELWMFKRFTFVMEFEQKPVLPPPFICLCHIFSILKWMWGKFILCMCEQELETKGLDYEDSPQIIKGNDHSLKTFLSSAECSIIFEFEEDNLDTINIGISYGENGNHKVPPMESSHFYKPLSENTAISGAESSRLDGRGVQQLKMHIQEMYVEIESQRAKMDKLLEYWEMTNEEKEVVKLEDSAVTQSSSS